MLAGFQAFSKYNKSVLWLDYALFVFECVVGPIEEYRWGVSLRRAGVEAPE